MAEAKAGAAMVGAACAAGAAKLVAECWRRLCGGCRRRQAETWLSVMAMD